MYHSPFHLIDPELFEAGEDPAALKRRLGLEKRKLLAEFELAGTPTIAIDGRELQRQDITALFDELQDSALLRIHLLIWERSDFLLFLETGHPGRDGDWIYPDDEEGHEGLLRFISAYYAEALNEYLHSCLQGQGNPEYLLNELRGDYWMLPLHQETAYRYATRFFTEKKNELLGIRYRSSQNQQVTATEIRDWCNDQQIHVLNRLPDDFDDLRYTLAELLNNLCVLYDRQQAKKHALAAIERAATIRVNDEELERLIPSNLRIIRNKNGSGLVQIDPDTGRRRVKIVPIIVICIILLRLLAAGSGCFDSNDDGNYRPATFQGFDVSNERTAQEESFESLLSALSMPQAFDESDTMLEKALRLRKPAKTGDNPFAPLFRDSVIEESGLAAFLSGSDGDSSTLLMRNRSSIPAVFLVQLGSRFRRSIYVAPEQQFALRYPRTPLAVQIYGGHNWTDTIWNSYLRYKTSSFAVRQVFRGGFRVRVPIAFEEPGNGKPMFSRNPPERGTSDTLSLVNKGQGLSVFYNLGQD